MEAKHTPGRIDRAIAKCEQVERDGLSGKYSSWPAYRAARDAAEAEYSDALTELSIHAYRTAASKAAQ